MIVARRQAEDLLTVLQKRDVVLICEGEKLHYRAPDGALTPRLREAMKRHKAELLSLLSGPQCVDCGASVEEPYRRCEACIDRAYQEARRQGKL